MSLLDQGRFRQIIAFSYSVPGAMGPNNMTFYRKNGKSFTVDYLSDEAGYSMLKKEFPVLQEEFLERLKETQTAETASIIIGRTLDERAENVPSDWSHIDFSFGNYFAVKRELFYGVYEIFQGKDLCDLAFYWTQYLDEANFSDRIEEVELEYQKQVEEDEILDKKIKELNQNPDYKRALKEASGDIDKMMAVFEDFSGMKIS